LIALLKAALLGVLQGLTEFLPVSSSSHLALMHSLLGWDVGQNATFDVAVHVATLAAVFAVFAPEIARVVFGLRILFSSQYWKDPGAIPEYPYQSGRLALLIIVGSIPTAILGFAAYYIDGHFLNHRLIENCDPRVVGLFLIITGCLLFATRNVRPGQRTLVQMRMSDAITIGVVQGIAVLPGISRSGSTICTGLLKGLDRKLVGRFSFLLAIPAILGAGLLKGVELLKTGITDVGITLVGMTAAFIAGYIALRVLLKVVEKGRLGGFAYYCWVIGLVAVVAGYLRA
jgi:undecaprenyl-diphosphatase